LQVLIEEKTVTDDGPYGADTIYLVVNVSANGYCYVHNNDDGAMAERKE